MLYIYIYKQEFRLNGSGKYDKYATIIRIKTSIINQIYDNNVTSLEEIISNFS